MKRELPSEHRRGLLLGLLTFALMSALVVLPIDFPSSASTIDQDAAQAKSSTDKSTARENYDIRTDKSAQQILADFRAHAGLTQAAQTIQQQSALRAETKLRQRLPALKVELNPVLPMPEIISTVVTDESNALHSSKSAKRSDVLIQFLKANNELVSLTDSQVEELAVTADYTNPAQNLSFVHLRQSIGGVPVFAGEVKAGFDKHGRLFRIVNNLAPGLEYTSLSQNFGEPVAAVEQAFKHVDREMTAADTELNTEISTANKAVFSKTGEDELVTTAEKMYFPLEMGVARAAWRVLIWEDVAAYYVIIDAETGTMLWRKNLSNHQTQPATYNVYFNPNNLIKTADNPAPLTPGPNAPDGTQAPPIPRTNVTLVGNEPPYTFNNLGWIPDGADTTEGNNTRAGLDRVTPNGIDALVVGQVAGNTRIFSFNYFPAPAPAPSPAPTPPNLPLNEPLNDVYQRGAVTHLFYTTNRYHDEMYLLGFTEQAYNFQRDNFGRGGLGNDWVLAEAQDFSGTNNANFNTPSDGSPGRMQMYLWPNPNPDRDGDLDAEIIIHELTHGTSNRLHSNDAGLIGTMAGGMGEGWGDWYAHTMLSEPTDPIEGIYTTGGYSTYLGNAAANYVNNYYYGIRRFPKAVISFRGSNGKPHNPLSFRHINSNCNTEVGLNINPISAYPRNPVFGSTQCDQVHAAGEIWSSALWEVRAKYIQRLGHAEGTRRVLQHVTDGMKLAPIGPTFLQERDAIIAAARAGGEQADIDDIWAGFALRGMGFSARVIRATSPVIVAEAFDVPLTINPSFEEGLAPWEDWGNSTIVANPNAPNGSHELRIGTGEGGVSQTVSAQPNTIYTLSGWGRVSTAGETGWIGIHYLDSNGNEIAPQSVIAFNNTTYEQKQLSVQTPPNTAKLRVWAWKPAGEGYFFVDNISLTTP